MSDNGTLHVLLDRNGLQSRAHLGTNGRSSGQEPELRLQDFQETLEPAVPCDVTFSEEETITLRELEGADVLVVPTRDVWPNRDELDAPFQAEELEAIERFVEVGGGLVLMSNHPPFTRHDRVLAERFGFGIEEGAFQRRGRENRIQFSRECLEIEHPIISGGDTGQQVRSIVINNGTYLQADPAYDLVRYPGGLIAGSQERRESEGAVFAAASPEVDGERTGRVVVMGDSGFMGSDDSGYPGPGLFHQGDNPHFLANTLHWVSGRL